MDEHNTPALTYFYRIRYVTDFNPRWSPLDREAMIWSVQVQDEPGGEWRLPADDLERRSAIYQVDQSKKRMAEVRARANEEFEMERRYPHKPGNGWDMGDFE
jgi:hypothetical protein